ncbi:MAG: SDR family oxidoreductase [Thermaceae bacterium]|nr:SDR family oxidoreductase [Thermaceae bacterium]
MAKSLFDLSGRRILITGSNAGIGLALAQGLAEHGATVILNGRNPQKLRQAADGLRARGWVVEESRFDVTLEEEVRSAIAQLTQAGPLDGLVNNAGIQRRVSLEQVQLSLWNEVLQTNLTSAFLVGREVAKTMMARGQGKIVNICSLMSEVGRTTTGPYTAAKGGLKMLTKAMCADWAQHNIQANAIGPGYFITEMTQVLADNPEFDGWVKGRTPARRWGRPEELVGAAVFLLSSASDFVNGQLIYVDGGMLASL